MAGDDLVAPPVRHLVGSDCPRDAAGDERLVGLDRLDALPTRTLLDEIAEASKETLSDAITALSREGGRGPAARRLLARDVQLARVQLRSVEALRNIALRQLAEGKGSEKRVALLEKLVESQHKRMLAALECLSRTDPSPPVAVKIQAYQAAVRIGSDGDGSS
jgi:hypothetical protein